MILSDRQIANHWPRWESMAIFRARIHSLHEPSPSFVKGYVESYRRTHAARCQRIAQAGIGGGGQHFWATVLRNDLDNPFRSEEHFVEALSLAIVRSRRRLGWSRKKKVLQSAGGKHK
jgi:hypothetical protein